MTNRPNFDQISDATKYMHDNYQYPTNETNHEISKRGSAFDVNVINQGYDGMDFSPDFNGKSNKYGIKNAT